MKFPPILGAMFLALPLSAATGSIIAVDAQGNIWRTGQNLPVALTPNAFQKTQASSICTTQQLSPFDQPTSVICNHAFVTKQDPSGNVLYATYLGGTSEDGGMAITTDAQGNAYVTGFTYSPDFPVTNGVVQSKYAGPSTLKVLFEFIGPFGPRVVAPGGDVFVAKFAPDGTIVYSTLLGGAGSDIPTLIAANSSGEVFIAGTTASTDFPTTPNSLTHAPQSANFFARINPQGTSLIYATYSDATIQSFDVDNQAAAYLTGATATGPYVTKVDTSTGKLLYATSLNSKFAGAGAAIIVKNSGAVVVGVSPAPTPNQLLIPAPPVYPLGPSFLLTISADGAGILAETDITSTQFDQLLQDTAGNVYAFGHGTGALPTAPSPPLLAAPCATAGGSFVIELSNTGSVAAATYLRQGSGSSVAQINAKGLSVYRAASKNLIPVDLLTTTPLNFGCLENLASGAVGPGIAPGQIFALFGNKIGPAQAVAATPDASGKFPTTLAGAQVLVNGIAAPLLMVQAAEIHGVVPFGFSPPVATVRVQYQNQEAPQLDEPTSLNPGIFAINGQAAILNQDGTVNTPSNPAKLGSIVSIYATGTGPLKTPLADGQITPLPPPYFLLAQPPDVRFANNSGSVVFAGSAPGLIAGATQINVKLPATLPTGTNLAAVPVVVVPPGVFSPPAAMSVTQ